MRRTESTRRAGAEPERCTAAGLLCPLLHPEAQYSVHSSDDDRSDDSDVVMDDFALTSDRASRDSIEVLTCWIVIFIG